MASDLMPVAPTYVLMARLFEQGLERMSTLTPDPRAVGRGRRRCSPVGAGRETRSGQRMGRGQPHGPPLLCCVNVQAGDADGDMYFLLLHLAHLPSPRARPPTAIIDKRMMALPRPRRRARPATAIRYHKRGQQLPQALPQARGVKKVSGQSSAVGGLVFVPATYLQHTDVSGTYQSLSLLLSNKYKLALEVKTTAPALEEAMRDLSVENKGTFKTWLEREKEMEYKKLVNLEEQTKRCWSPVSAPTGDYAADAARRARHIETQRRHAMKLYNNAMLAAQDLGVAALGIALIFHNIRNEQWARPAGRLAMDPYFKLDRVDEEIIRLIIEIRRRDFYCGKRVRYVVMCWHIRCQVNSIPGTLSTRSTVNARYGFTTTPPTVPNGNDNEDLGSDSDDVEVLAARFQLMRVTEDTDGRAGGRAKNFCR
ncbi:hypothetical protein C8R43DRAFT_955204 [Mycena crocata]|nr:hypothetical protein C8R43DRAFT_955204 [Mycena crocata]